jgi:hypothetical protein
MTISAPTAHRPRTVLGTSRVSGLLKVPPATSYNRVQVGVLAGIPRTTGEFFCERVLIYIYIHIRVYNMFLTYH